jgi:hypothetical protein
VKSTLIRVQHLHCCILFWDSIPQLSLEIQHLVPVSASNVHLRHPVAANRASRSSFGTFSFSTVSVYDGEAVVSLLGSMMGKLMRLRCSNVVK